MTTVNYKIGDSILPTVEKPTPIALSNVMVKVKQVKDKIVITHRNLDTFNLSYTELDLIPLMDKFYDEYSDEDIVLFTKHLIFNPMCIQPIQMFFNGGMLQVVLMYVADRNEYYLVPEEIISNNSLHRHWYFENQSLNERTTNTYIPPKFDKCFIENITVQNKTIKIKFEERGSAKSIIARYDRSNLKSFIKEFDPKGQRNAGSILRRLHGGKLTLDRVNLFVFKNDEEFEFAILTIVEGKEKNSYYINAKSVDKYIDTLNTNMYTDNIQYLAVK